MTTYHIAQVNVARMVAPLDSEEMSGFVNRLDEINALADEADGFVWRLQTDDGDATSIRVFDDEMIIVNMSVWESLETLHHYTYKTVHAELIKGRKNWFEKMSVPHMAIWYIPAGHIPTPGEAQIKLDLINEHGTTPMAFTFAHSFSVDEWLSIDEE